MEKLINIDGRDVKFKSTGAFLLRYKNQFGRDALQDMFLLSEAFDENSKLVDAKQMDMDVIYRIIWTLAKTADEDIEPFVEFFDSFDNFPITDILPELMELVMNSLTSTKKKVIFKK